MDRTRLISLGLALILPVLSIAMPSESSERSVPSLGAHLTMALKRVQPGWSNVPPRRLGSHFFVGESHGAKTKDEALEKAWISAFVRIGMAQFPELTQIRTESVETLKNADYKRQFVLRLEMVDWTGISEAADQDSPFVVQDEKTGDFSAYRLLQWSDDDIEKARKHIQEMKRHELPPAPEEVAGVERGLVDAVVKMKSLNHHIANHASSLGKIFREVKCGVKIRDLKKILGEPDWQSSYVSPRGYRWGTYEVEADPENIYVAYVIARNGTSQARKVCD